MPIKHVVLAGGGYLGLHHLGVLTRLLNVGYLKREHIQTFHGTSIGAFFATVFCLNDNWDTTLNYFIERPWHKAFNVNPNMIFNALTKKGLYGKETFNQFILPLIKSRNFNETMTLNDLYELSNITLYMYTIDLNTFTLIELSHKTHPDLLLLDALYMTCALPYLFQPYFKDNVCYIDGGLLNNYPLLNCIGLCESHNDILGVKFMGERKVKAITQEHNVFEYGYFLYRTLIKNVRNTDYPNIPNEIVIPTMQMNIEDGSKVASSAEERKKYIDLGKQYADRFLATIERI